MRSETNWKALRSGAANLQQRDLVSLAERLGWTVNKGRGKGSHYVAERNGRTITIPQNPAKKTVLSILKALERSSDVQINPS